MCIERNIKHKFCYEIDGKTATLLSNGVDSLSFWQNWFCLWCLKHTIQHNGMFLSEIGV